MLKSLGFFVVVVFFFCFAEVITNVVRVNVRRRWRRGALRQSPGLIQSIFKQQEAFAECFLGFFLFLFYFVLFLHCSFEGFLALSVLHGHMPAFHQSLVFLFLFFF